ncbi:hypothetical protein SDC9_196659 [bioreactor metagenome]|uniref:ATP-dependent DNA helicase RecG domain-containing protein n=1 Tax=bioreactor metagenome TaxID=1076179 RepID=A0A645IDQ2_9ZZZZ
MVKETDGFEIAKKDLEIRGPGKLLGNSQHGIGNFYLFDLVNDMKILKKAQMAAEEFIENTENIEYAEGILKLMKNKLGNQFENLNMN